MERSWAYLAEGSPGAELVRLREATIACFVRPPDRDFFNNAVLDPAVEDPEATLAAIESAYAERGIERFAVWTRSVGEEVGPLIRARGYRHDTSTAIMAMEIGELVEADTSVLDPAEADLAEFWRVAEVPGLAPELDPEGAYFYVSRLAGEHVATLMTFDHDRDCGIYMVGTAPAARRRGIATALSSHAVVAARERGCRTASLQATPMAVSVYASIGFRELGRFDEYVPER
jgi:ribosomal protein S18 acetylase RimI-like enzyme